MELTASGSAGALPLSRRLAARLDAPAMAAWLLAFATVAYLAMSNGGYDAIVRSHVGIAVWWIVLLTALAGILPARIGPKGWTAIALLAGLALWTGLATGWSQSAERSTVELGRVVMYLGVLVLAISLQGRSAARHTINGLACAIALVTFLAVLSRLHPQWFSANDHAEYLGAGAARKLSYPLNYWNGLAAFAAMGVPVFVGLALQARTLAGRGLAAAMLPLSALCVYLTISRGGALAFVVGTVVFLLLVALRWHALGTLLVAGAGATILLSAASQRDAVQDGAPVGAVIQQGSELLWLIAIVCGGVALLQVSMSLAARHVERPAVLAPSRRAIVGGAIALLVALGCLAIALGAPRWATDRWTEFKAPVELRVQGGEDNVFSRLSGVSGNGRYQYWQAAREANATAPWTGIGPGAFEFWWARHSTDPGFIRDAHTLYFETLAETGIVGLALLVGFLAALLVAVVVRSLRAPPGLRTWIAAGGGGLAAFMTSAAFEWIWELAAIACVAMLLAAVVVAGRDDGEDAEIARHGRRAATRAAIVLMSVVALGAIALPAVGALATRESRDAASHGRLEAALGAGRTAERIQPYAAGPRLQQALVLEQAGAFAAAAAAASAATDDEPTNWRTWLVLARVEARRGDASAALAALRAARRLNPRSPILGGG